MPETPLNILSVSVADRCGGAEKVAWDMFREYRRRGHRSHLLVGEKHTDDPDVSVLPDITPGLWRRGWRGVHHRLQSAADRWPGKSIERLIPFTRNLSQPGKWFDRVRGWDDFRFPNTYRLFDHVPFKPDVIHCHNLHGYFFDLRALPWLSRHSPVVLSLHDAWLLSGLCGHSFDCDRWKTGCGQCPYLSAWQEPAWSSRDGTAYNWGRKKEIFARCRLHVTAACRWMAKRIEQSILAPAAQDIRVIPNGVDLEVFKPGDRGELRASLGISTESRVCFFVARGLASNPSKDYATLRAAIVRLAEHLTDIPTCFIARGEQQPTERIGNIEVRYIPWTADDADVAQCYQIADVYVHAAKMDTFPLSLLEAQACGTPVISSAVGGIPEQVKSLHTAAGDDTTVAHDADQATGILVPPTNAETLASAIELLLRNHDLRLQLGTNALQTARAQFDVRHQAAAYLSWYAEMVQNRRHLDKGRPNNSSVRHGEMLSCASDG